MSVNSLIVPLSQDIQREYEKLTQLIAPLSTSLRSLKTMDWTGGVVSVNDLIAYQIGWGACQIRWYEAGIRGEMPSMPGEGFSTWDYVGIARHFYQKHQCDNISQQDAIFHQIVVQLFHIVEREHQMRNLEKTGVWNWCTLKSGKKWPLSKWIRVNTCSPYKRARLLIMKNFKK